MSECKDDQERSEIRSAMDASKKALYHHTGKHVSVCSSYGVCCATTGCLLTQGRPDAYTAML